MYKLILLFALVAVAVAAPGYLLSAPYAYSAPAPAYIAPAPYSIHSSYVVRTVEPVEQHGYKIVY